MSRIGKIPVAIPEGVDVGVKGLTVTIEGPKGKLSQDLQPEIKAVAAEGLITLERSNEGKRTRALHGLYRSLLQNMVTGVSAGFEKTLLINGVGYRAEVQDQILVLNLGYSNPIDYPVPEGVSIEVENNTRMKISGIRKDQVGQVSAEIRSFRPPEPYKGKGVKYLDETITRKVGKSGVA